MIKCIIKFIKFHCCDYSYFGDIEANTTVKIGNILKKIKKETVLRMLLWIFLQKYTWSNIDSIVSDWDASMAKWAHFLCVYLRPLSSCDRSREEIHVGLRTLIPFRKAPLLWPQHLPKTPILLHWSLWLWHWILRGYKHEGHSNILFLYNNNLVSSSVRITN